MFNVGFGEILLIVVVFIVATEPAKFKEYLALLRFFYLKFTKMKKELLAQIGFDVEKPEKYIMGEDGVHYPAYPSIIKEVQNDVKNDYNYVLFDEKITQDKINNKNDS